MKLAVIGDLHLGCSDYTDKRTSDFFDKFVTAVRLAMEHDAQLMVLLGDVFDSSAYRRRIDSFASVLHDIAPTLVELEVERNPHRMHHGKS
jgi:DNA repair exonuclease SbcCD nuclease subunit